MRASQQRRPGGVAPMTKPVWCVAASRLSEGTRGALSREPPHAATRLALRVNRGDVGVALRLDRGLTHGSVIVSRGVARPCREAERGCCRLLGLLTTPNPDSRDAESRSARNRIPIRTKPNPDPRDAARSRSRTLSASVAARASTTSRVCSATRSAAVCASRASGVVGRSAVRDVATVMRRGEREALRMRHATAARGSRTTHLELGADRRGDARLGHADGDHLGPKPRAREAKRREERIGGCRERAVGPRRPSCGCGVRRSRAPLGR